MINAVLKLYSIKVYLRSLNTTGQYVVSLNAFSNKRCFCGTLRIWFIQQITDVIDSIDVCVMEPKHAGISDELTHYFTTITVITY